MVNGGAGFRFWVFVVTSLTTNGPVPAAAFARSALEPRLLGRQIGLPPLLTLLSLYAGYRLFGLTGMILLPLAVLLAKQVWELAEGNGGGIDGAL